MVEYPKALSAASSRAGLAVNSHVGLEGTFPTHRTFDYDENIAVRSKSRHPVPSDRPMTSRNVIGARHQPIGAELGRAAVREK